MGRLKILMADDHDSEIEDARRLLESLDHEVLTANAFDAAMELAGRERFDIAVIDLGWYTDPASAVQHNRALQEMGGFRVADVIRERHPGTQLILYSNRTEMPNIRDTAAQKRMLCVQKNFDEVSRQSLVSMVRAFAQLLSSVGTLVPPAHAKLQAAVRSFLADTERHCEDPDRNVFIMTRFQPGQAELEAIDATIRATLATRGLRAHRADDRCYVDDRNLWDNVCTYMLGCRYGIAVLEDMIADEFNPNVALEYGFMRALGKEVLLLKERRFKPRADIMGVLWEEFDILRLRPQIEAAVARWMDDLGVPVPDARP